MRTHHYGLVVGILSAASVLLAGCANPEAVAATQSAQTAEADAATLAAAPTSTRTPIPPTPTATVPPGPTPSGKFEFFDVAIEAVSADEARVSFGYQMEDGLDLDGVKIMAQFSQQGMRCNVNRFTIFSSQYEVTRPAGLVADDEAVIMGMQNPGKCTFSGFKLLAFRLENQRPAVIYEQEFKTPFELEKK